MRNDIGRKMKLVLLVGPPGSGKSTLAMQYGASGYVHVNQDTHGKKEHLILFQEAIALGKDIVVDRLNFVKIQRERYLNPAKLAGYETEIVVLHESYKTCFERCLKRENHPTIKDEVAARQALGMFFGKYERVQNSEADKVTRIWPSGSKPDAVWIDIDNTLSDATHREHFLQGSKKNWTGFFENMVDDPVNNWCKSLIRGMNSEFDILICSGRPDNYKKQTQEWLNNNDILYDELFMRLRNDSRKDSIVKEIIYEFQVKTDYNLIFCVDDRKQVIDQIRSHGVIVLDCAGEKGHF